MTDVETLLMKHGIEWKPSGSNLTAFCFFCGGNGTRERTLAIHRETGAWVCNRPNSCGRKGGLRDLQAHFGEQPIGRPKLASPAPRVITYKTPDASKLESKLIGLQWFEGREIKRETVEAFGIRQSGNALAFPVHDQDGKLVNIKWRSMTEKKFWNEAGTLRLPFGLQNVPPDSKSLLIVEGEIDALTAYQYGIRAVISLPNGVQDQEWIEHVWEWLDRFQDIFISTDMDEAGRDAMRMLVERLGNWRCRAVELPHKDLNECLMNGLTAEKVRTLLEESRLFMPDRLKNAGEFSDAVVDAFKNKTGLQGTPTGFADLNRLLKGWRGGELSVWTGRNGSGKSTVLGQEMVNQIDQGEKVCIASLELAPTRYLRWLVCQISGLEDPPEVVIRASMDTLAAGGWFVDHVGKIRTDVLLDTFEYAARRFGVRHFVVDSLVKLGIRSDDYEGQSEAVSALCDFADRFNCHVHLVAHPRKGDSDDAKIGKVDIKGSGDITDLADNVFALVRNKDAGPNQASAILFVQKNREHGQEGEVLLKVDPRSKRVEGIGLIAGGANERQRAIRRD